jgi:hypothetical protein
LAEDPQSVVQGMRELNFYEAPSITTTGNRITIYDDEIAAPIVVAVQKPSTKDQLQRKTTVFEQDIQITDDSIVQTGNQINVNSDHDQHKDITTTENKIEGHVAGLGE